MTYAERILSTEYQYCHYKKFDYNILKYITYGRKSGKAGPTSYNDIIIMVDTETSKSCPDETYTEKGKVKYRTFENHIVIWTISLRAYGHNIATIWGYKPSKLVETINKIHACMSGEKTLFFVHNLAYDYVFLRKFLFAAFGHPEYCLNVKSHYPIVIEFANGVVLRDSLIMAQRKLEKWASDLNVAHKKAVGFWDYDKIRNQGFKPSDEEFKYIECDTLAGVECLDAMCTALSKKIYQLPLTATGVPREQIRKRSKGKGHQEFLKIAPTFQQYSKLTKVYHGGCTHGNRHYYNMLIDCDEIKAGDFASSYPYIMVAFKMPMEKFTVYPDCHAEDILESMDDVAFMFKFTAVNIKLKSDDTAIPALQFSKCTKSIGAIVDNGRILAAQYVEIWLTEYDLAVIWDQYICDKHICTEVESAHKQYLPRWFTNYVFECFANKTLLKGADKVLYAIAKSVVNCLYGMCCQKSIQDDIVEDYETGEYSIKESSDPIEEYQHYLAKRSSILPYQWGVWVTAIAFFNLHQMIKCCRMPYYCDTDSCYGSDWDWEAVNQYNEGCKDRLRANGYGPVLHNDREYWLGIIEHNPEEDTYTEYKYMGAKRYCGRNKTDGQLHLTVAGVPKKGVACLNDDIKNFAPGFIFSGSDTGKMTHVYIYSEDIHIDANGNEIGDSISLIPCDYELDSCNNPDWESLFEEEVNIQVYDEY